MKNLKKTLKKFRKVRLSLSMKIISLLSCIALVSMGFASWWIIKADLQNTEGSFVTYDVEEKNVTLNNHQTVSGSNANITFGKPSNMNLATNYNWLKVHGGNDHAVENLVYEYTFDLAATDKKTSNAINVTELVSTVQLTFKAFGEDTSAQSTNAGILNAAITNGYITAPKISYKVGDGAYSSPVEYSTTNSSAVVNITIPQTDGTSTRKVTVKVEFNWGTKFNNTNPYTLYNAQAYTDDLATAAATNLAGVDTLNGIKYEITYALVFRG